MATVAEITPLIAINCEQSKPVADKRKPGFQPGKSGNPTGRPKAQQDMRAVVNAYLNDRRVRLLLRKMGQLAMKGDKFAIAYLLDQRIGKALQSMQVATTVEHTSPEARRAELSSRLAELAAISPGYVPRPETLAIEVASESAETSTASGR